MPGELGESQLSSLLESVPGLASVLRSPVADAMVNMIRAGAGLGDFDIQDAQELVQYATRRGLIPQAEGAEIMVEVEAVVPSKRRRGTGGASRGKAKKSTASKSAGTSRAGAAKKAAAGVKKKAAKAKKTSSKKVARKAAKKSVKKTTKASKPAKKKAAGKKRAAKKKGR
jgi:hypothetical protein